MKIFITNAFERAAKKLYRNQIAELEEAIEVIKTNPIIGEAKVGDLAGIRVYKFHISPQLILLAYLYNEENSKITLLSFGPHENFYEKLKRTVG
ncbi:MAG: type II toxin-antitoxin system RelE/ParE family toxin [Gammaproteobacteria bacterium]|nr:type II toxin-antitoxin system RelE/ParE family toxin [Gammaproteobacteria bacterium]